MPLTIMKTKRFFRIALWIVFGVSILLPVRDVARDSVTLMSLGWYLLTALFCWFLILPHSFPRSHFERNEIFFLGTISLTHLTILAILATQPVHFHYDEFIVANTTITLPTFTKLNWFGVYPDFWVAQFPTLFHLLQKPFFLLGPSVWAVRFSTWPYSIGIIIYLYLLASRLFNRQLGYLTLIIHTLFAPTLYLNSTGLHFISSELFYLGAMTHLLFYLQSKGKQHLFLLSFYIVASYLTYTASYVTLPVVMITSIGYLLLERKSRATIAHDLGKAMLVVFILFLPFLTFHARKIPFLTQRSDQVNIFNGTWSDTKEKIKTTSMVAILATQTQTALKALYLPDIGGIGEYEFGKQPVFHPLGLFLFILGCIYLLMSLRGSKSFIAFAISVIFLLPFILGFILTTHPPPYHRISLIYPFIALISALPLYAIYKLSFSKIRNAAVMVIVCTIGVYSALSTVQILTMLQKDKGIVAWDTPRIASLIKQSYPQGTPIYVAAFPTFHYQYELPFRLGNRYPIVEEHKKPILDSYVGDGPLIINQPEGKEVSDILQRFPKSNAYDKLNGYPLMNVVLIMP